MLSYWLSFKWQSNSRNIQSENQLLEYDLLLLKELFMSKDSSVRFWCHFSLLSIYLILSSCVFHFFQFNDSGKIYKGNIWSVCENGAVIYNPRFEGELIVMIDHTRRAIVVAKNVSDPEMDFVVSPINDLITKEFTQCISLNHSTLY